MLRDAVRRAASQLDASYTEDLGRLHRAISGETGRTPMLPAPRSERTPTSRIAVVAHVFYPELLDQIRAGIGEIQPRPDVFVSVPDEAVRKQTIASLGGLDLGRLDVRVVDNRGRDIAPKYVTFAEVYTLGFDLLLFLHTKKSLTADFGGAWRDQLFRSLAGSRETVNGIIGMFEEDPGLGVVAPAHNERIGRTTGWDGNYPEARRLAQRAGLQVHRWSAPDFASGSMFWARPEALADLTALRLDIDEFPREDGQVGITIMHALERMVFVAAARAGFRSVMVTDPEAQAAGTALKRISMLPVASSDVRRPAPPILAAAAIITAARVLRAAGRRGVVALSAALEKRTGARVRLRSRDTTARS